jgi:signal recognition particle subunit SEC65
VKLHKPFNEEEIEEAVSQVEVEPAYSTDLSYPIGKFEGKESYTPEELKTLISRIERLPAKLEAAVNDLSDEQLDTPYREGGWTLRQVVHHVSDSHLNAYIRTKWTLTENTPTIKAYNEKNWAETPDKKLPVNISINLLRTLHSKWTKIFKALRPEELSKEFIHPDTQKHVSIGRLIATYAWHGDHHLAHINYLRKRMGW